MREPTEEEAFALRRAAWIINSTELAADESRTALTLHELADNLEAPSACEGCGERATGSDVEGVPLCEGCGRASEAMVVDRIRAEWKVAAAMSNDTQRSHALAEWARKYGPMLCDAAEAADAATASELAGAVARAEGT